MPLACFLPKVASTIKIQILPPKPTQGTPRDHWQCACTKSSQNFQITKTAITLRLLVTAICNSAKITHNKHTSSCKISAPYPPAVQKLSPKRYIFNSFQDPCQDSFQDPGLDPFKTLDYLQIQHYSYVYESSFQDPTRCHCNCHFCSNTKFDHFKTLDLVYSQDHVFQPPKVWLACRGPATGIWWVGGSDHPSITCIQHQLRHLVCNDYWLSQ